MGVIYTGNNLFSAVMTLRGFLNNFSLLRKYGRWLGNMIMGEREIFNGYYYKQLLRIFLSLGKKKKFPKPIFVLQNLLPNLLINHFQVREEDGGEKKKLAHQIDSLITES